MVSQALDLLRPAGAAQLADCSLQCPAFVPSKTGILSIVLPCKGESGVDLNLTELARGWVDKEAGMD